jgi:hypothetical protein
MGSSAQTNGVVCLSHPENRHELGCPHVLPVGFTLDLWMLIAAPDKFMMSFVLVASHDSNVCFGPITHGFSLFDGKVISRQTKLLNTP